jgi:dipeptide transport system permease protein
VGCVGRTTTAVTAFLVRRLLLLLPTFIGITLAAFFLIRLVPGDPIEVMVGERKLDAETHARLVTQLGLDQPLIVQYGQYLKQTASGDLGTSIVSREPVAREFAALFPATIELALAALVLALVVGVTLGALAALNRGKFIDQGVMGLATLGYSMPIFWWGLVLIMVFSVDLGLTPVSGRIAIEYDIEARTGFMLIDTVLSGEAGAFTSALRHLLLPALVLGTVPMAVIARMTRSALLEVLREDFMRSARARGLSPLRVVVVHGLRNALIPVITVVGLQTGALLGGAVLTETIFSWPGIGKWLIDSIGRRDYPVVQAGILISALTFIAANLVVDVLYGVADPRIRDR